MAFEFNDANIARIALIAALLGLVLLVFIIEQQRAVDMSISSILQEQNLQRVSVNAKITSAFFTKNALLLQLYDGNKIAAVLFNPSTEQRRIAKSGNLVMVIGKIQKYQGKPEIVIEGIEVLDAQYKAEHENA